MPRLFFGNFDFEHSLGNRPVQQLPVKLQRVNALWTPVLIPLMQRGDYLWIPEQLQNNEVKSETDWRAELQRSAATGITSIDELSSDSPMELVPWGWTDQLIDWAKTNGWTAHHPQMDIVRWSNSRATSFAYEREFGSALPGMCELLSLEQLQEAVNSLTEKARWLVKVEFSMSARERLIGIGNKISIDDCNWIQNRLAKKDRLFFEPWLDRIEEVSFHYQISQQKEVTLLGITELLTDSYGRYLSNRSLHRNQYDHWQQSAEQTALLVDQYAIRGYFGPISIDAMSYRTSRGEVKQRPLQDVNARYSMGRCMLEKENSFRVQ